MPLLYFLAILLAVSSALPAYIQSNFLGQIMSLTMVSWFFAGANLLTILAIIFFPVFIEKFSNYFSTKIVLAIYGASLLGLTLTAHPLTGLLSIILFTITSNLILINMDILVEAFSENATMGRTRTIYYTFINLGWIGAPLLSSYLIKVGEYQLVFLIAAFLVAPIFLIVLSQRKRLDDKVKYVQEKISLTIKKTWRNKNLRGIFFIALLLSTFFSAVVLYVPIYLHGVLGISWSVLGPIFSLMLLPFILIEIPAGIIADKYWGEKEMLMIGFAIMVISLFLFFYIKTPIIWLWALILFFSRCGAALVEAMRETYFFKIIDARDVGYINIFRAAIPFGYVVGTSLAVLILSFFPLNYIFLFFGVLMLSGFGFAASIKDTK